MRMCKYILGELGGFFFFRLLLGFRFWGKFLDRLFIVVLV